MKQFAGKSVWPVRVVGLLLLFAWMTLAPPVSGQSLSYRSYDSEDGLACSAVRVMAQDHSGYMWLGTYEGLCRYDGTSFKIFSNKDGPAVTHVQALCVDSAGLLWIGTRDNGVFTYDGSRFVPLNGDQAPGQAPIHTIIEDSQGRMWVGAEDGLYQYAEGKFSRFLTEDRLLVYCILEDRDHSFLLGTNQGLLRFSDGTFEDISGKLDRNRASVWTFLYQPDGSLLVSDMFGIFRLQGTHAEPVENSVSQIKNMHMNRRGETWLAGRLGVYKLQDGKLVSYREQLGEFGAWAHALCEDHEGNMWFGSVFGVRVLINEAFISFFPESAPSYRGVNAMIVRKDGRVVLVNDDTVFEIQNNRMARLGTAGVPLLSVLERKDSQLLFGGVLKNLFVYSPESKTLDRLDVSDRISFKVNTLCEDAEGALWIGTVYAIWRLYEGEVTSYPIKNVNDILTDRNGVLWIGSRDGLTRLDNGKITSYTEADGLADNNIECLAVDEEGGLWLGTDRGLNCYKDGAIRTVDPGGQFADKLCRALVYQKGDLYVGMATGLYRIKLKTMDVSVYTEHNGLAGSEVLIRSMAKDADGNIWVGTMKGLTCFNPDKVRPNPVEPFIHIQWASTLRGELLSGAKSELAYDDNSIRFEFVGISYSAPGNVRYRYRMIGVSNKWVETDAHYTSYTFLPPGPYTFEVMACNNDGVWNETPATLSFYIASPFWATWWFRSAGIAGLGLLLFGIYRIRTVALCRKNKALQETVEEREQMGRALAKERTLLRSVIDVIPESICLKDAAGVITLANKPLAQRWGYSDPQKLVGKTDFDIHPDEIARVCRIEDEQVIQTRTPIFNKERRVRYADGEDTVELITKVPLITDDNQVSGVVRVNRDITGVKRIEDALKLSEQNLRITLNSIADGVVSTDKEGRITRMNPAAERFSGRIESDAEGCLLTEVFPLVNPQSGSPVENPATRFIMSGEPPGSTNLNSLVMPEGKILMMAVSGAPLRIESGEIIGSVLVFRDMTKEVEMQEQLNQSRKMDAIGQLAGGVAHDFNNMLMGIMGGAELLERHLPSDNRQASQLLSLITDSARRAANLAAQLLVFGRKQAASSTPVDVHNLITATTGILSKTIDKRIQIQEELKAEASVVIGDESLLQNVFLNLGINASHAMPAGGSLSFETRVVELNDADCNESPFDLVAGSYIEISVRDTGGGIHPKDLPRIFEPFFTTKEQGKGTGLGLATAYGTVQQHKGEIRVVSDLGRGTCFTVRLPLHESTPAPEISREPLVIGRGAILVVDDEPAMRDVVEAVLTQCGYDVLLAANGREAVEIYRNQSDGIDVVVCDMVMPEMNGLDCFRTLKTINPSVRFILVTGFASPEDVAEMTEMGLAGLLRKPYRNADLSHLVFRTLTAKGYQS